MNTSAENGMQDVLRRLERCEQRQKAVGALMLATIVGSAIFCARTPAISQTPNEIQNEILALQNKLKFVSTSGTEMLISGANLHIVNGSSGTDIVNGLGNLIIGYNEKRADSPSTDLRTGSHNLILGEDNSYTSYGGIVAGRYNTITGTFACIQGGFGGTASGPYSSICGGNENAASGAYSFVGGGEKNAASGLGATVTGGQANAASAHSSSVSGGNGNISSGEYASIGGGIENKATGIHSFVCGGHSNSAIANDSAVVGGLGNATNGGYSVVLGGKSNTAVASLDIVPLSTDIAAFNTSIKNVDSSIAGIKTSISAISTTQAADENSIDVLKSANLTVNLNIATLQSHTQYLSTGTDENGYPALFVTGCNVWVQDGSGTTSDAGRALTGLGNLIIGYNKSSGGTNPQGDIRTGSHNLIVGEGNTYTSYGGAVFGFNNSILAAESSVTGGQFCTASGAYSAVNGGTYNTAMSVGDSVAGGYTNRANGGNSSIAGGEGNMTTVFGTSILGGYQNSASGYDGVIAGGFRNILLGDPSTPFSEFSFGAILGGQNITLSTEYGTWPLAP